MSMGLMIAAGIAACSSDPLESGTQALTIQYTPDPSGSGRFDRGLFDVQSLQVRPADPALIAIYGTTPLTLRFGSYTADMTQTTASTYAAIALAEGTYNVSRIILTRPQLVDTDVTPSADCIDNVSSLPSGPATGAVPNTFTYLNPPSLSFTVRPGQTTVRLTVDIPGLISSYENAFTCNPDCGGGTACLTTFDAAAFTPAFLSHITLQ